jgi:hypothetical protein
MKPESGQSYEYGEQKSSEKELATTTTPEEKADQRSDNHQNRIDNRDPPDRVFADDETMIEPHFNEKYAEPSDQH